MVSGGVVPWVGDHNRSKTLTVSRLSERRCSFVGRSGSVRSNWPSWDTIVTITPEQVVSELGADR
eukprot:1430299-Pyramimonas_sp.AAC.2